MLVELFSICDAATDQNGRLNILGVFEGVASTDTPVERDRCSIVARIRFQAEETGEHALEVRILDGEGKLVVPKMGAKVLVKIPSGRKSAARNLVLNINRLSFPSFGEYKLELVVDGAVSSSLPLLVAKATRQTRLRNPMEN